MIQNYDGPGISMAAGNGSGLLSARGNQTPPSEKKDSMADSQEALETDTPSENRTATKNTGSPEGITEGIAEGIAEESVDESADETVDESVDETAAREDESPWYDLNGLDEDTKTITIAVSYTHLDVYKRQLGAGCCRYQESGRSRSVHLQRSRNGALGGRCAGQLR